MYMPDSIFKRLLMLIPATKKYIEVLKIAKKEDWFASTVLCNANFSLKIKSLFILKLSFVKKMSDVYWLFFKTMIQ